jgi:hypothetical protein
MKKSSAANPFLNPWTSFGLAFFALFALLLVYSAGKGIDPTDESFYLYCYAAPARFLYGLSWFGFAGSIWRDLAGGSVFWLRLLGYVTMLACAGLCVSALARQYPNLLDADENRGMILVIICSIYATLYMPVVLTPGYNSITACGLALTLGGVGLLSGARRSSWAGSLLIGLGCALVLFGKPNSFPALLALLGLWALKVRPELKSVLTAALVCAAIVLAVIVVHMPISETWRLVVEPVSFLFRFHKVMEPMHFGGLARSFFRFFLIFCSLCALAVICPERFAAAAVLALSAVMVFMLRRSSDFGIHALAPSLALGLILLNAVLSRQRLRQFVQPEGPHWDLILLSFAFPFCYFLGTNVPLTMALGNASFFWWITVLLCLGRLRPRPWVRTLSLICFAACVLWMAFWSWHAFSSPYRHGSKIWEETEALTDVPGLERVHVTPAYHIWVQRLRTEAAAAGFRAGMPVLDISGGGPGLMLFIRALPAGSNWILGGYRMSTEYLRFALDHISDEDRPRCWILRLRGDKPFLRFDLGVLRGCGIDPESGYEVVWQDKHPLYPGEEAVLLRPIGLGSKR